MRQRLVSLVLYAIYFPSDEKATCLIPYTYSVIIFCRWPVVAFYSVTAKGLSIARAISCVPSGEIMISPSAFLEG